MWSTSGCLIPALCPEDLLLSHETTVLRFFAQHAPVAGAVGVGEAVRTAIAEADWDSPALTADDRTLIAVTREVITRPRITDATFGATGTLLSPRMIVELIQVCGFYFTFGRICTALDLDVSVHGAEVPGPDRQHARSMIMHQVRHN